jgi:hypothetical protein
VKDLAEELGISTDSVYRAYRTGEIPAAQIARIIRFDLGQILRAMEKRANAMPNSQCSKRRAQQKRPRSVKQGRSWQIVGQEVFINGPGF